MRKKIDQIKGNFDLSSYEGLEAFKEHLAKHLHLRLVRFGKGCLKISVTCHTLEILERLWDEYRSGHLNAVAEECLITEKVKDELDMETIRLTTTLLEEDYLACKLSFMEISGTSSKISCLCNTFCSDMLFFCSSQIKSLYRNSSGGGGVSVDYRSALVIIGACECLFPIRSGKAVSTEDDFFGIR